MANANTQVGNTDNANARYCFAKLGGLYLIYLPSDGETTLDLSGTPGSFAVSWFNPRTGGLLPSAANVNGGADVKLNAPDQEDWLALVRRH